jgi:hypothetical protein
MYIAWASLLFFEGQELLDEHNAVEPFSCRFSCSCQTASPFLAQVSCSALTCFAYRDRGVAIDRRFDGSLIVFDVCSVSVALPTYFFPRHVAAFLLCRVEERLSGRDRLSGDAFSIFLFCSYGYRFSSHIRCSAKTDESSLFC